MLWPILRNADKARLADVLGQEYATEDDCVKAVWEAVCALLRARDGWWVLLAYGGGSYVHGPFWREGDATKVSGTFADLMGGEPAKIGHLFAPGRLDPKEIKIESQTCDKCNHPKFAHGWAMAAGGPGCLVGTIRTKAGKVTKKGCGCLL